MGLLNKLKGIREAEPGVQPISEGDLKQKLLALNDDRIPFRIATGTGEDGNLVAEWKIVDEEWYEIFAKASIEKSHTLLLGLSDEDKEVRALEESREVKWRAGVPTLSASIEVFKGRTVVSKEYEAVYAWKSVNPLDYGKVYEYSFDVSDMKDPISEVITKSGWTYRPVMSRGKLAS